MKAIIPYDKLQLVNYEGAGNKTPVLSLDVVPNIHHYKPQILRGVLEKDIEFRRWLSEKGRELDADTVMIYYSSYDKECEYVTFIGEPNAPGDAPFSEMCGNGIRSLALHIFLTHKKKQQNYRENGITIWAGMTRTITINEIDDEDSCGFFSVEMGPFQHTKKSLGQFTSLTKNEMFVSLPGITIEYRIGFNGEKTGEPHVVFFFERDELNHLVNIFSLPQGELSSLVLQQLAAKIGNILTFDTGLFPLGVNVNVAVLEQDKIHMATHERNLIENRDECTLSQGNTGVCRCVTRACGTGGSAVVNIAAQRGMLLSNRVITMHPGGKIIYTLLDNQTIMTGPAQRIE